MISRPDGARVVRVLLRAPIGFRAGQKKPYPIINRIFNGIINPISPFSADFSCWQLVFHIRDS